MGDSQLPEIGKSTSFARLFEITPRTLKPVFHLVGKPLFLLNLNLIQCRMSFFQFINMSSFDTNKDKIDMTVFRYNLAMVSRFVRLENINIDCMAMSQVLLST